MKCQSKVVLKTYYFKGGVSREKLKLKEKVDLANAIIILTLISIKSSTVIKKFIAPG